MLRICFAITVLLIGCGKKNKNPDCGKFEQVPVLEVDAPASGRINEDIPVVVNFVVFNGCGQFGRFEESVEKNLININLIAKYSGCICTDDIPGRTTTYHFKTSRPGRYILKFEGVRDAPAVSDTINIE